VADTENRIEAGIGKPAAHHALIMMFHAPLVPLAEGTGCRRAQAHRRVGIRVEARKQTTAFLLAMSIQRYERRRMDIAGIDVQDIAVLMAHIPAPVGTRHR